MLVGYGDGSVEYKFRYLTPLHTCSVGTLRRTLKLKAHRTYGNFGHSFLSEIT